MMAIRSSWWLAATQVLLFAAVRAQNSTCSGPLYNRQRTVSWGIIVFPGWEPLDVFGPLQILFSVSAHMPQRALTSTCSKTFPAVLSRRMTLSVIAASPGPVSAMYPPHVMVPGMPPLDFSHMLDPKITATHSFADAPDLDILLVPGGMGNMALDQANDTSVEDFVARRYPDLEHLLSVCTGAASLAKAGVLEGKRATTNKGRWAWVTSRAEGVNWVPTARWVVDGKIWTSSGVAAGMDMTSAFLRQFYGEDDPVLISAMNGIEYAPHTDADWDPFSVVHQVPGADPDADIESCVRPVGW